MKCPFCFFEETKVTDSRVVVETNSIKRRRECLKCEQRFTTFETLDLTIQVKKRDGTYEDFVQEKLIKGLDKACSHTAISHDDVRAIVDGIKAELMLKQLRVITSGELGEMVIERLRKLDDIAYIRFACVYRRFKDLKELKEAIDSVTPEHSYKS